MLDPKLTQRSLGDYVALKVAMASDTTIRQEVDALATLCISPNPLATAQSPIPRLLDSFDLKGPNGVHQVLALEVLGGELGDFITEMKFKYGTEKEFRDLGALRELSRQIVYAVHYVHSKGIVHRGSNLHIALTYKIISN